jgi:hypothetical protein
MSGYTALIGLASLKYIDVCLLSAPFLLPRRRCCCPVCSCCLRLTHQGDCRMYVVCMYVCCVYAVCAFPSAFKSLRTWRFWRETEQEHHESEKRENDCELLCVIVTTSSATAYGTPPTPAVLASSSMSMAAPAFASAACPVLRVVPP